MKTQDTINALFKGVQSTEQNERQNIIFRLFLPSERYLIDFSEGFTKSDWEQFDTNQDAPYFGVWINKKARQTLTYCEGDWTLVSALSKENFIEEIKNLIQFYKPGHIATCINPENGQTIIYRQDRKEFLSI